MQHGQVTMKSNGIWNSCPYLSVFQVDENCFTHMSTWCLGNINGIYSMGCPNKFLLHISCMFICLFTYIYIYISCKLTFTFECCIDLHSMPVFYFYTNQIILPIFSQKVIYIWKKETACDSKSRQRVAFQRSQKSV